MRKPRKDTYVKVRVSEGIKQAYQEALEALGMNCSDHLNKEIERLIQKASKQKKSAEVTSL